MSIEVESHVGRAEPPRVVSPPPVPDARVPSASQPAAGALARRDELHAPPKLPELALAGLGRGERRQARIEAIFAAAAKRRANRIVLATGAAATTFACLFGWTTIALGALVVTI